MVYIFRLLSILLFIPAILLVIFINGIAAMLDIIFVPINFILFGRFKMGKWVEHVFDFWDRMIKLIIRLNGLHHYDYA